MIPRCMIHLALLSCLAAPLAASPWAQVQPAEASPTLLAWKPAAGAKFVKRVELAQELGLARLAITMGGVEQLGQVVIGQAREDAEFEVRERADREGDAFARQAGHECRVVNGLHPMVDALDVQTV